ncbi:MAG: 30S ribosomal protein S4e [Theionarchaea archaeon]|nr:MAG: hypothetical protein AYK19_13875 [Theionarchaea archaeon DG-70-1]MBU7026860.1 30S ribosomal protein S4e [Theionarchaea archaeon]
MARKGQKRGLKRSKAPKSWRIARKEKKWTINPHSGPHNKEAIPLAFILRDYLGYAHTLREAKRILNERKVEINGTVRCDFKFPVGIMDVVDIPVTKECFRVLLNRKGNLMIHPIPDEEKHFRPLKIAGKYLVKGGRTQLRFHDGTTLLVDGTAEERKEAEEKEAEEAKKRKARAKKVKKVSYAAFGTVLYDFNSKTIVDYFPFAKGNFAVITGGRNVSRSGSITSIKENFVEIEGEESFRTLKDNVFVIGTEKSVISLPGG